MVRRLRFSLLAIVLAALIGVVANVAAGNTPALGLDLQGGASVTLQPVGDPSPEALDAATELIRQRVDSLGVAEPEIVRQGDAIVVSLPGVSDPEEALATISATGQVFLRPVLGVFESTDETTPGTDVPGTDVPGTDVPGTDVPGTDAPTTDAPTTDAPTTDAPTTTAAPGPSRQVPAGTDTVAPSDTAAPTDTAAPSDTAAPADTAAPTDTGAPTETLAPTEPVPADTVVDPSELNPVPGRDGLQYFLGPTGATGEVLETGAEVQIFDGQWTIVVGLRPAGQPLWNALASECYNRTESCPTGQLAIQLDTEVISAPVVQEPSFGSEVTISGDFSEAEATNLAKILEFGALPVEFEDATVQVVSATLGEDSLFAAIIAGIIGVLLVLALLFFYYRGLTIVIVGGLLVFAGLTWTIVALLGATSGLALTLSGAAGLIVSVGITVDSYVVYFEKLKDELRAGRTFRNSAARAFDGAWRTILVADAVSFIGALILWYLTVGSVRGFAFFLGLATLVDMAVAYFYTRPAVIMLSRSRFFQSSTILAVNLGEALPTGEPAPEKKAGLWHRLYHGETTFDFYGKRRRGFVISIVLVVTSVGSLVLSGLNLGIDFEGGVAWEVPSAELTDEEIETVLTDNGVPVDGSKIQTLSSGADERVRIQVGDQPQEVRDAVKVDLAAAAGVSESEVSVSSVSSSWGRSITEKAVRALLIFFVVVSAFIAWRFEWRMALAAFIAMIHDVVISVGIYALLGLEVTPATVVAFLTILGYSLYDTIVVFDKVRDNSEKFKTHRIPMADIVNVSMNQVVMRSLNTSISSILPVISLLVVGSWILGAQALEEFAIALLVGMLIGAYSSIFVATPILAILKEREPRFRSLRGSHSTGEAMHALSVSGPAAVKHDLVRRPKSAGGGTKTEGEGTVAVLAPEDVLTHPPRPRKKRRR